MLSTNSQQATPIIALPPTWQRNRRAEKVMLSPRVIAARLDRSDRDVLRLVVKMEHPMTGCTLRVGKNLERDGFVKRLGRSRRSIFRAFERLEALGLIGAAEGERENGSQTTTHRFLNQQLLLDIGAGDLVWDESLRDPKPTFELLAEVGEILAVKRSLGAKRGNGSTGGEGVTFHSRPAERDTPRDTPVTPLRVGTTYLPLERATHASREQLTTFAVGAVGEESVVVAEATPPPTTGSDLPTALGHEDSSSSRTTSVRSSSEDAGARSELPWASDVTDDEPWYARRVRWLQAIITGRLSGSGDVAQARISAFRELMQLWDAVDARAAGASS